MCYELYKNSVLVYSDCEAASGTKTQDKENGTIANVTFSNTTISGVINASAANTTAILASHVNYSVLDPVSDPVSDPVLDPALQSSNRSAVESSAECCACHGNTSFSAADNESSVLSAWIAQRESLNNTSVVLVNASGGVRTSHVVRSDAGGTTEVRVDEGHWLVVLLCIVLFVLCVVHRYARTLRWQNTVLRHYTSAVAPASSPTQSTEEKEDEGTGDGTNNGTNNDTNNDTNNGTNNGTNTSPP